jgi:hypothetical protein
MCQTPLWTNASGRLLQPGHHLAADAQALLMQEYGAPIGVAQALLVGARLAGLPVHFDGLYVSPVTRVRDTRRDHRHRLAQAPL